MLAGAEKTLRNAALALTALLVLVLCWSGARWLLLDEPKAVLPAESSLRVVGFSVPMGAEELAPELVSQPLFWAGRKPYEPPVAAVVVKAPPPAPRGDDLDEIKLQGVIGAGDSTHIIVRDGSDSIRLGLSDTLKGWTFVQLTDEGAAELELNGRLHVLTLEHAVPRATKAKKKSAKNFSGDKATKAQASAS